MDEAGNLSFEVVAGARLCCVENNGCEECPLKALLGSCYNVTVAEEVDRWLKILMRRLESLQKKYSEISDDEFLQIIVGGTE